MSKGVLSQSAEQKGMNHIVLFLHSKPTTAGFLFWDRCQKIALAVFFWLIMVLILI